MRLLYTLNALKSRPNDLKLITPNTTHCSKVDGLGQTVTSSSCQLLESSIPEPDNVDTCILLLLLLLGGSRTEDPLSGGRHCLEFEVTGVFTKVVLLEI